MLQCLDVLEERLPLPLLTPNIFSSFTHEEKMDIVNVAGEYQSLADILMEHPVIKFIKDESEGMEATRA